MTACGFGEKYWCQLVTGDSDGVVSTRQADVYSSSSFVSKCVTGHVFGDRFLAAAASFRLSSMMLSLIKLGTSELVRSKLSLLFVRHVSVLICLRGGDIIRRLSLKYKGVSFR